MNYALKASPKLIPQEYARVKNVHDGIERIRNVAALMNVKKTDGTTPRVTDVCNLEKCEPPIGM